MKRPVLVAVATALLAALLAGGAAAAAAPASGAPKPGDLASAAREASMSHYLRGLYLEQMGDIAGAMQEVARAFAYDPTAADIALKLSDLSLQGSDAQGGLDYARRAVVLGESSGKAHFLAGAALVAMGRPAEAEAELARSAAADSTNRDVWEALGRVQDDLGHVAASRESYAHAYTLDPEDPDVLFRLASIEAKLGNFTASDSLLALVQEANPFQPGFYLMRGYVAERLGNARQAADAYSAHLRLYPDDMRARKRLVASLVRLDDRAGALNEAKKLFDADPRDFESGRVLTSLYLTQDRDDDAVAVVKRMRDALPGQVEPAAFTTAVLLHVGKDAEARSEADALTREAPRDYRAWLVAAETWAAGETKGVAPAESDRRFARAREVLPDSTSSLATLARSLTRARRYEPAEQALRTALDREPKNAAMWLELAFSHERRKDVPGAEEAAKKSLELDPRRGAALNFLGYLYADYNVKLDQAVPLIQKALVLEPDNPYYIDSLGWAYYRMGRYEDARVQLERAIELGGDEPEVLEHLGDVYRALARNGDAKSQYRKALQLDPTSATLPGKLEALR